MLPKQNQHRVPEVYLKHFGYKTAGNQWKISTLDKTRLYSRKEGIFRLSQKSIGSITAEQNLFDLEVTPEYLPIARKLEQTFGEIESHYSRLVKSIEAGEELNRKDCGMLFGFIASLIGRTPRMQRNIEAVLDSEWKDNFLHGITERLDDHADRDNLRSGFPNHSGKNLRNVAMTLMIWNIQRVLRAFQVVYVHSKTDGWNTCDQPVIVLGERTDGQLFSIDADCYFPLSKGVLLYAHCADSTVMSNSWRSLPNYSRIDATKEDHARVNSLLSSHSDRYIFFSSEASEMEWVQY